VIRSGDIFETLDDLKQMGKIKAYGVSVETCEEALAAMEYGGVAAIQVIFNLFRLKPAKLIFPVAKQKNVGIIARVPLASGLLTGKFSKKTKFDEADHRYDPSRIPGETFSGVDFKTGLEAVEKLKPILCQGRESMVHGALKWILSYDAVSTVIPGIRNVAQALSNTAASASREFSGDELHACENIYNRYFAATFDSQFG
jgi:aryl-alcohol dehydrogenase-like predicted oxidoreductase